MKFSPTWHLSRSMVKYGQVDCCKHHLVPKAVVCFNFLASRFRALSLGISLSRPFLLTPLSGGNCLSGRLYLHDISLSWHPFLMSPRSLELVFPCHSWHPLHWQLWILTSHSPSWGPFLLMCSLLKGLNIDISLSWHLFLLTFPFLAISLLRRWTAQHVPAVSNPCLANHNGTASTTAAINMEAATSLLSSLLYFLHFSTFLTSLLSSLLYFLHFSTFLTPLLSSLLHGLHFCTFITSLFSSRLYILHFSNSFLSVSTFSKLQSAPCINFCNCLHFHF